MPIFQARVAHHYHHSEDGLGLTDMPGPSDQRWVMPSILIQRDVNARQVVADGQ